MGRKLGEKEIKSARKAASSRENAKRPRPSRRGVPHASMLPKPPEVIELQKDMLAKMRTLWPACFELARQILMDDLRDKNGRPRTESVYFDGKFRRRRVHAPVALQIAVAQDIQDRSGNPRRTQTEHTGENLWAHLPVLVPLGDARPSIEPQEQLVAQPKNGNGNGNGVAH